MTMIKINKLAIAACFFVLLASCSSQTSESSPEETPSSPSTEEASTPSPSPSESEGEIKASGNFVDAEHPTTGAVTIINEGGKNYLEFGEDFQSDDGPDLFVLLHKSEEPKTYQEEDYVSLKELQSTQGTQRYEIPDEVNIADYKSTVIWCRKFNATFGYANLALESNE